jgi:preprotein translocase subunit YajC
VPIAADGSGGSFLPLLLFILFPLGIYFLMIRPQQRRAREMQQMQSSLQPGAEVMTGSGIYGIVIEVDEEEGTVDLEISEGVVVRFAKGAVARVITPAEASEEADEVQAEGGSATEEEIDHDTDVADNKIIERKD